jgi:hypothetical protein
MSDPSTGLAESATVVRHHTLRAFLVAPSVRTTGKPDGVLSLQARSRIQALRTALFDAGVEVYSTGDDQDRWTSRDTGVGMGDRVPGPFRAAQGCDVAFAYIGTPLSAAVGLELGYASSLRKPIVMLVDRVAYHQLIRELESVTHVLPIVDDPRWSSADLRRIVTTALDWVDDQAIVG